MDLTLVREDRVGLTSGVPAVPPGASPGIQVGNRQALKASKCEAGHKIRVPFRVVADDDFDRLQVYAW